METMAKMGGPTKRSLSRNQWVTWEDLQVFKRDLLFSIQALLSKADDNQNKKWLKSYEVRKLLNISYGTLQTLRSNGTLPFSKIGGTIYYDIDDINRLIADHKRNLNKYWKPDKQ
ncbi:helix-turn-helix domain-containing protein [Chitinophaga niabensis]|uniref:Helix-turn-helix domain-containing protein n=1 Tax=Chitinophaga niabensis TaxID=536979 RepID=A0A1N6KAA9_9BACT|nr:helix-turn-helix domain-containing protein [Chitinophaga niabensis]SIO53492.1 Helix-turn-helix domain-containing protein [Chitinophaga niabensis]